MSLKKNTIANYLGQGWVALMTIAFVPTYIKYLGIEAYGLIGIFTIMQAWLSLLDAGMTPTLSREMARYTAGAHNSQSIRDLLRSIEVICLTLSLLTVSGIWYLSDWISVHWLRTEALSTEVVINAIRIIGFVIALRFIEGLYKGAILGLQNQVWVNIASSFFATLRGAGSVFVLAFISPSIEAFFIWQGCVSILTTLFYILKTYKDMPSSIKPGKFSLVQLRNIKRFAGGIAATTLTVLILTQIDKIILSHILTLELFGYYTLAGMVSGLLYLLTGPITQACYPQFTKIVTKGSNRELIELYHLSAQIVTVLIVSAALMLFFFGRKIIFLWTGELEIANQVGSLLSILALGTMLNCLMHIPYLLTLAYGWPSFGVRQNIIAIFFLVPAIFLIVPKYGAIGAAWIWVILNLGYVMLSSYFIHAKLLPSEKRNWYLFDILLPSTGAAITATLLWFMEPKFTDWWMELAWLLMAGLTIVVVGFFSAPLLRKKLKDKTFFKSVQ